MFNIKTAAQMAKEFIDSLPPELTLLNQEIQNQLRQSLQAWLHKMNLVTREEFDIQTQVLAKTRTKLEQLEILLAKLSSERQ